MVCSQRTTNSKAEEPWAAVRGAIEVGQAKLKAVQEIENKRAHEQAMILCTNSLTTHLVPRCKTLRNS